MSGVKTLVKNVMFGAEQPKTYDVRLGLLRGLRFEVDVRIDTQQLTGLYEREIARPVREFASQARSVIDIGAGDGYYTLFFASQPGIEKIIACEPQTERVRLLERNLASNPGCRPERITVLPVCVGNPRADGFRDLDSLLETCPDPVLVKTDVEGAEREVLESGRRAIANRNLMLIIETHSAELERECVRYLNANGYQCEIRDNGWYRKLFPELRPLDHNRWLTAKRADRAVSHHAA